MVGMLEIAVDIFLLHLGFANDSAEAKLRANPVLIEMSMITIMYFCKKSLW